MRREHNEILQIEPELVFHAPLTSNVTDIIGGIVGTRNTNYATFDSYASTRGIRITTYRYQSPIYWTLPQSLKTKLINATYIKTEAIAYPLAFYQPIPNVNNGTTMNFMDKHTSYTTSDLAIEGLYILGNGTATAFQSLNVSNIVGNIYEKINGTWYISYYNKTTETATTPAIYNKPNINFTYFNGPVRYWSAYGSFTGHLKDIKIWVK